MITTLFDFDISKIYAPSDSFFFKSLRNFLSGFSSPFFSYYLLLFSYKNYDDLQLCTKSDTTLDCFYHKM